MKKLITALFIIAAMLAGSGRARSAELAASQAPGPVKAPAKAPAPPVQAVQAGPVKIGFINVRRAVSESDRGKAAIDRLQTEVNQTKTKLDAKKKEIDSLRAAYTADQAKWDTATRKAKEDEINSKGKALQREAEDYEEYYNKREGETLKPIIDSLNQVITEIGKKEGYTVIYDVSGAILYINPATEVTDKVIRNFNARK